MKDTNKELCVLNAHSTLYYFSTSKKTRKIPAIVHDTWWWDGITCPSMIFKRKIWEKTKFPHVNSREDSLFLKKAKPSVCTIQSTDTPLFAYRVHNNQISDFGAVMNSHFLH